MSPSERAPDRLRAGRLIAGLTLLAVLLPLPLLLPALNERAVLSWYLLTITEDVASHAEPALLVLALYVAVLLLRYVAFVTGSTLDTIVRAHAPFAPRSADRPWPLVSIVVPAYNEGPVIRQSLRSLLALDYPCFEIIVVDDGSSDDTVLRALEVAAGAPQVQVIRQRNAGKAAALNTGLSRARGQLVLNMDADSRLGRDTLHQCVRHFDDPAVGAVAGNIKVANRENLATRLQAVEYVQGLALERRAQSAVRAVSVIGGPLGMFRREALIEAGGYDHDTFAEDRDLTLKLLERGWQVTYEPAACAWAESPSRWLDLLSQRYRWTRGTVQAIFKHRESMGRLRDRPALTLSLWYTAIDSIVVPVLSLTMLAYFAWMTAVFGSFEFLFLWWLMAALFDVAVTAYAVVLDHEDPGLIAHALLYRFYTIFTDLAKVIATLEELLHVEMGWGKLMREGKI